MRSKLLLSGFVVVALVALASVGYAGDYHRNQSLVCQDCHVMHYSQSHGYEADGSGFIPPMTGGPNHYLLRQEPVELCLGCHDNQAFAPDVLNANFNSYYRQAGGMNDGTDANYSDAAGHTLGSLDVAPGGVFADSSNGLWCGNCHGVHGSAGYRNLGGYGTAVGNFFAISYAAGDTSGGVNDLTKWVYEDVSTSLPGSGNTLEDHYGQQHITFNEPVTTDSQYATFCKACHTEFHGTVGGAEVGGVEIAAGKWEEFIRHPMSTVNIGAIGGGHSNIGRLAGAANQVQVMSPAGKRAGDYLATDTDLTPSCMSCHKAHGNMNSFGLIFMVGSGATNAEEGDGFDARNTCRQCHGMGGSGYNY